jgi:hypothetical protein
MKIKIGKLLVITLLVSNMVCSVYESDGSEFIAWSLAFYLFLVATDKL